MMISINGQSMSLGKVCTVRQLLDERGLGGAACAVEINRQLVPKRRHEEHLLCEGDQIEIVTLVGGG